MLRKSENQNSDLPDRRVLEQNALSLFKKSLFTTDMTVLHHFEPYTGEKINKVEESTSHKVSSYVLSCTEHHQVSRRTILSNVANQHYICADSIFIFEKLSTNIQFSLLQSDNPAGCNRRKRKRKYISRLLNVNQKLAKNRPPI
jgi:hypothetical protein